MRTLFLVFCLAFINHFVSAQSFSSAVEIATVYSQNEQFYLKTVPFDNESPSLRGKTSVYRKGNDAPLYVFERGFDSVDADENNLILSNDGEVIFYVIPWGANDEVEGLKSISIYKNGKLIKSYTEAEITGCDYKKERCDLVYSNYEQVVDREKSNAGTRNYKKVFKDGIDEKEKFLNDYAVFNFDDVVYLVDSKKQVHQFDLKEGKYIGARPFKENYEQIKSKGRSNKVELERFDIQMYMDFPNLQNGKNAIQSLADFIGMKPADISEEKEYQYKLYSFKINGNILSDGSIEIENIEYFDELPKEKIAEFFKTNKFDRSKINPVFEKWKIGDEYFTFRKKDDRIARQEKQDELNKEREELKRRLVAEKINDIYIPKDLGECFIELDKLLSEVDKKEMKAKAKREDMIEYHFGLGMWLRNNWGLWGGSRLQKYFADKKVDHPDDMSSIILEYYYDWLNGKTETWKDWENKATK